MIGRDRLPTLADEHDLPYISAIVKEVLRWRPVAPRACCSFIQLQFNVANGIISVIPRRCTQVRFTCSSTHPQGPLMAFPNRTTGTTAI